MKLVRLTPVLTLVLLLSGCVSREESVTNLNHPGPAVGHAVGATAGAVTGQVAGAVVSAGQAGVAAAKAPFNNERRVIRTWRTETTSDGRTIQVPVDTEVDAQGRPITK